jgi:hypothetical protein
MIFVMGAVLYISGYFAVSLATIHCILLTMPPSSCVDQKMSPNIVKCPLERKKNPI